MKTGIVLQAGVINENDGLASLVEGPSDPKLVHLASGERLQGGDRAKNEIERKLEIARQ